MDRSRFQAGKAENQKNLLFRLRQKAKDILSSHSVSKISESTVSEIKNFVQQHIPDVE